MEDEFDYNLALILLTRIKQARLDLHGITKPRYAAAADYAELLTWPRVHAESVYIEMRENIFDDELDVSNLASEACAWCAGGYGCDECEYGKRNGRCKEASSDFRLLCDALSWEVTEIFKNSFYRNVIKRIDSFLDRRAAGECGDFNVLIDSAARFDFDGVK